MPKLDPVWEDGLWIGTSATSADPPVWTYAKLCAGIQGMPWNGNEQIQQFFFLCGNGYADNEVTGMAPEIQVTGRRIVGDTAQDYIMGQQFELGNGRKTSVKVVAEGKQYVCDATICDVVTFGGDSLDINAFSCNIRFNGKPTITTPT